VNSNQAWKIEGIENYPKCKIQVFNRWGELVFQVNGPYNNTWKGECGFGTNCKSGKLPDGTYYYQIEGGIGITKNPKLGALYILE